MRKVVKMKKHAILLVSICLAFLLAGCGEKVDNLKENVDEKVSLITGKETVSDEEKAKEVAKNFAKDLLTFKGKTEENYYTGGLQYVHPGFRDTVADGLKNTFLPFQEIVKNYDGEENLPEVSDVIVDSVSEEEFVKEGKSYKSYRMDLTVRYKDSKTEFESLVVYVSYVNNTWVITGIEL